MSITLICKRHLSWIQRNQSLAFYISVVSLTSTYLSQVLVVGALSGGDFDSFVRWFFWIRWLKRFITVQRFSGPFCTFHWCASRGRQECFVCVLLRNIKWVISIPSEQLRNSEKHHPERKSSPYRLVRLQILVK